MHAQELCPLLSHTDNHAKFNPSDSSTFTSNGQTYTLSYGSGELTVVLGYDTLTVSAPRIILVLLGAVTPAPAGCLDARSLRDSLRAVLTSCAAKTWPKPALRWAELI